MVNCPGCNGVIDVDEDELDEGDVLSCDECLAELKVVSLDPLELVSADDLDDDEDDDAFLEDDEEEEEEDEDDS